ncbi:Gfo/Idh/MocA family oxidoreductase, partial [Paenibacillus sepulcri]|nr:Gfo/Idh/MocA family oxidoreductase [Paenibacillus sepulcri]
MSKVRVGIIGTGGIAGWHARQLLQLPEVQITALADTSEVNRNAFVEKYGLQDAGLFSDYEEMLEQAELDAVVICSPHTLHFQQANDVLNKGLHVLIE